MRFKKLRRIYRILFPIRLSEAAFFEKRLRENELVLDFRADGNGYFLTLKDGLQLFVRNQQYSDFKVFEQIFNFCEYKTLLRLFELNTGFSPKKIIIDAGANVGYTFLYFSHNLDAPQIIAIEPSEDNFRVCRTNAELSPNRDNIVLHRKALSETENRQYVIERDFRDKKDWSITTREAPEGTISGISINEIVKEGKLSHISLLKIDIEGAERFIFRSGNDLSYLDITELVAVEIHDEFDVRDTICALLASHGFLQIGRAHV